MGVTNRTVKERFAKDSDKLLEILKIWSFATGAEALTLEQKLLASVKRVTVKDYLKSGGNTELFEKPLLI